MPPETNTTHEVARRAAELDGGRRRRLERRGARVRDGREAGADADGHGLADDTARPARRRRRRGASGAAPSGAEAAARPYWLAVSRRPGHRRLRAHGRGQDRRRDRARRAAARARRGPGRGVGGRDAGLRRACRSSPARRARTSRRGSSTGCSASCPIDRDVLRRRVRRARARTRSTRCSQQGRRPIVVGGTGLYLRAALAELDLRPPVDPAIRERWADDPRPLAAAARRAARGDPRGHRADRPPAHPARARAARGRPRAAAARTRRASCGPAHTRHPTLLAALVMDRERARRAHRRAASTRCSRPARVEEVRTADAAGASATARRALGFQELLDGDVEAMKTKTRRYAKRQLTWLRKLPGAHLVDMTDRDAGGRRRRAGRHDLSHVRFEKWQALGNDYLIFEEAELTPAPGPDGCATRISGRAPTACCVLDQARRAGLRRAAADLQPRRLEAELSGNGAREAILYLRRNGWTDADTFSIQTLAGEIRPTITSPTTCTVDMGRAHLHVAELSGRTAGRTGRTRGRRADLPLPARRDRQPAVRDPRRGPRRARPATRSARRSRTPPIFPNRTNVSFWHETRARRDPRADLRARRGGDALQRHRRVRRGGGARAPGRRLARHRPSGRRRADRRRRRVPARGPDRLGEADLPRRAERGVQDTTWRPSDAAGDRSDRHDRDGGPACAQGPRRRGPRARARRDEGAPPARPRLRAHHGRPRRPAHARPRARGRRARLPGRADQPDAVGVRAGVPGDRQGRRASSTSSSSA